MHAREPASFWWKNVTVVVIPLRGLARMSCGNRLSNVRRLTILRSGKVFTSSNKDNTANFYGEKKCNEAILFSFFFWTIIRKSLDQTSYSKSFSSPESEGLYYLAVADPGEPFHPHPPPPHLILRPNWDPAKGRKNRFETTPPPTYLWVCMTAPPFPLISRSASDTVSYNLTCRFQPLHFGDVVVQLKYTRIASVSCFL